ncbi:MAG: hypothetical protein ABFD83_05370 [Armatimonadota bacterium]
MGIRYSRILTAFAILFLSMASYAQTRPMPGQADGTTYTNPRIQARIRRFQNLNSNTANVNSTSNIGIKGVKSRLTDINTLKYALIDKKTHVVTFVGKYDPAYPTGPIPYDDILKDVLNNAYPSFSLEPTPDQKALFMRMDKAISVDIAKMNNEPDYCNQWANKLISILLNDPAVAVDNKRFMKHFGDAFSLSAEEFRQMFYGAQNMASVPQEEWIPTAAKMIRVIGLPKIADMLNVMSGNGGTGDMIHDIGAALGILPELDSLKAKLDSGQISQSEYGTEGYVLCFSEILRQLDYPADKLQKMADGVRNGSQSRDVMADAFSTQLTSYITDRFGEKIINGLVFSPELMTRLYDFPLPQSELVYTNVPSDSVLGGILFRADYLLKTICSNPDLREQVPGHMTDMEFQQQESIKNNYFTPSNAGADVGSRLIPADVTMSVSPTGDVVRFDNAHVKVTSWVREYLGDGWDSQAKSFLNSIVPKYADYVTAHLDDYAKVYPELYRMQEVAKLVALARWAKSNGYTLAAGQTSNTKIEHPKTINGFWSAVFQANQNKFSLTIIGEGGASFSSDEGEEWVKPNQNVEVTSDVCKQLVASAVFANQAANAAVGGNMEEARDLADKSARAMTGEIDYTKLPSLSDIPMPTDPGSYAAADKELIDQAGDCLKTMDQAQKDMAKADSIAPTQPEEAEKIRAQATKDQDEASEKLQSLMSSAKTLQADPSQADDIVVSLKGLSGVVRPIQNTTASSGQTQTAQTPVQPAANIKPVDMEAMRAKWIKELDETNRKIEMTKQMLTMLNKQIQTDQSLYNDWEKMASEGMDKCKSTVKDLFFDTTIGLLADRFKDINEVAQKLPASEADTIEKYRRLESLTTSMKNAKDVGTYAEWQDRENKTDADVYESIRDGIGQISGLLSLDTTVPGLAWKYGSMTADLAYTFTQYYQAWNGIKSSTDRTDAQAAQVKKLSADMQALIERYKELHKNLDEANWKQ